MARQVRVAPPNTPVKPVRKERTITTQPPKQPIQVPDRATRPGAGK